VRHELRHPSPRRIFAVCAALQQGISVDEIHALSRIDHWFLHEIDATIRTRRELNTAGADLGAELLLLAKKQGFSDKGIARAVGLREDAVADLRRRHNIRPRIAQIDTLAAEYPAETNYLYFTYHADHDDVAASWRKKVLVLGSGAYRIGASVEFDWCSVNAVKAARELGFETIVLNYNPETVSTDYDVSDKLIFDEISFETVVELYERERPYGVIVSMGGQVANNLAIRLHRAGVKLLGTPAESVDRAEDRQKFGQLLDELQIDQPKWTTATDISTVEQIAKDLGGYPVLVRPSYVLSGAAMTVAHDPHHLTNYLRRGRLAGPPGGDHEVRIELERGRDRRGGRQRRDHPLGHQRAHRERGRALGRRDSRAAAAEALHRDHPAH
jgi:carbamoyl-phosphate synthase large subunit